MRSDRFQNCEKITQQWNADGVPASWSTTYCKIKEMGYANRIPRVKPLLNFKQCKKRLTWATDKQYWTVGQWSRVIFSDEPKFCISFGNWVLDHEFRGSPTKLTNPAARNPALNFHKHICVFCEQISLLLSIKKSWSIFCLRRLSNCWGGDEFTFQHDLAPAHNAKSTKMWFTMYGIQVLSWLANSSDLNLIENLKNREEEDCCLSTDYFGAAIGIHQASLELHYTCRLPKVGEIHAKTISGRDSFNWSWVLSTEDFSKLLKVHVYCFVLFYSTVWLFNVINLPYCNILISILK